MGHSEMLLAVAGLKADEIKARTRKLANSDWSDFLPAEALAFAFASKVAKSPAKLTNDDITALQQTFGVHRSLDIVWYTSWCNYMTRIADAFQLPLEKTNVFAPPVKAVGK